MKETRIKRIASELKKEISSIINNELKDTRISPITSITELNLSDDLQSAKVYISVLGDKEEKIKTIEGLKSSKGYIKKKLGSVMNLRHIPEIIFTLDEQIENALKMEKLIDEVIKKDNEAINNRKD